MKQKEKLQVAQFVSTQAQCNFRNMLCGQRHCVRQTNRPFPAPPLRCLEYSRLVYSNCRLNLPPERKLDPTSTTIIIIIEEQQILPALTRSNTNA